MFNKKKLFLLLDKLAKRVKHPKISMKQNYFKTLFFILFPAMCFAQTFTIQGTLIDDTTHGVAFANLLLTNETDAKILYGGSSDEDGDFKIENVSSGKYILKITYLGLETRQFTLSVVNNINLGNIELSASRSHLEEVVVTAKKPTVENKIDRLVFHVENTSLSNGDSWDLLSNTPTVIAINGELRVRGRETPVVYINDKKVYLTSSELKQLLEGTPANVIKSVEVITNPPARYDAEGGALINIVMSKNIVTGYNGSIFGGIGKGNKWRTNGGTNHFYKTDKLHIFGGYNYSNTHYLADFLEHINFRKDGMSSGIWSTDIERETRYETHTFNANVDFFLSKNQTLGLTANVSLRPYSRQQTQSHTEALNAVSKGIDSTFVSQGLYGTEKNNLSFNLNYEIALNEEGQKFSANAFFVTSNNSPSQRVNTEYSFPNITSVRRNSFINDSKQDTRIYAGQIDYILPTDFSNWELGAKLTKVETESSIDQNRLEGNSPELNDLFTYDETNIAAYISFDKEWEKWGVKAGLRGENTSLKGVSFSESQTNTQDYFQLFPSFYLNYKNSDNHTVNLQYSRRILRPNYKQLNPFRYYFNDNSFQVGNPKLQPSLDHKISLGNTYKQHSLELYFALTEDPSYEISFQDNEAQQIQYIYANVEKNLNYGIDYYSYLDLTDFWGLNSLISFFYDEDQFIALEDNSQLLKNGRWAAYFSFNNYFTFLQDKSLTADLWLYYISPLSWGGTGTQSEIKSVDLGITKTFMNNRASLTLKATDIFNTFGKLTISNDYLSQQHFKRSYFDEQSIRLSFRYKFGNYKLSTNQKDIELEEKDRIN